MIDQFSPGSQNRRLLERLMRGPILNHEIRDNLNILNHSARISDVRKVAREHGYDVPKERIVRRVYQYRLAPLPVPVTPRRGLWEKIKSLWEVRI